MKWLAAWGRIGAGAGNLIHQRLSSLQESATIFFDPNDGDPWGIAYTAGVGNTQTKYLSWTPFSDYHDIGPL
jgi:hypothetical protein